MFEWMFGKKQTPQERLRKNQRALEKTQRELDRERLKLEQQERKLIGEIKKSGRNGQMRACKIQAKDLIRTKKNIQKFAKMKVQLQAISLRIQTVRSNEQMTQSMRNAAQLLGTMNKSMNLPQIAHISQEFSRQTDIMSQREEMMDDSLDDLMDEELDDEDEEEVDEIISKVLDEIGVDLSNNLIDVPGEVVTEGQTGARVAVKEDDDLQARLDDLRR
ncbi:ESCRT-III complex protein [Komagataella phaffii CBS 7435]|uniref:Uncharacterized protein n=2 Tax=Komagataella phaffii TaxID=460519 RepID=C4R391_KOMPG|nr:Hypothetical protein PAS_c131_0013 [Komagataella phaffii GS115]AOA63843.1 GQ67_04296T0 [Komagataella phaffii]KAI0460740.1 ESCRT-III subunit protein did4 [Komagataella kurtzmanii]CAH2448928.1 ESCRT-III complex protein [Komagataella phaffii CBS 7435]AOA68832.1 GQ68_04267T0 [Komagataella phaffii GS115]CAY71225.1 Hypothetical protein PAS_c131_0013 [Komagataella phaffii GS115]